MKEKEKPRNEKPLSLKHLSFKNALKKIMSVKYDPKKEKKEK